MLQLASLHYTPGLMWRRRIGWTVYQLLVVMALMVAAPFLLAGRGRHYLATLRGRLGLDFGPSSQDVPPIDRVWIHAVSVGEVAVAATLIAKLPKDLPLVVTTVTPTGQDHANQLFGVSASHRVKVAYLPFDVGFAVSRFFKSFAPTCLILVEGDYWPLILETARRRNVPVAVVNGRVGKRSGDRLKRIPWLSKILFFDAIHRFAMQTPLDGRRLVEGGAASERIQVVGNLKFDSAVPEPKPQLEATLERLANGRAILLAGSTMAGEDPQVLDAFLGLGAGDRALLLLAPRHPQRFDSAADLLRERSLTFLRRSNLDSNQPGDPSTAGSPDVVLLDTLGELASLYRIADIAFIGGTLVPTGGHNPLEPALFSVPTVVGPAMTNFQEIADQFDEAGAWGRVADSAELTALWKTWLANPQEAREFGLRASDLLAANRGALERTLSLLNPLFTSSEETTS